MWLGINPWGQSLIRSNYLNSYTQLFFVFKKSSVKNGRHYIESKLGPKYQMVVDTIFWAAAVFCNFCTKKVVLHSNDAYDHNPTCYGRFFEI